MVVCKRSWTGRRFRLGSHLETPRPFDGIGHTSSGLKPHRYCAATTPYRQELGPASDHWRSCRKQSPRQVSARAPSAQFGLPSRHYRYGSAVHAYCVAPSDNQERCGTPKTRRQVEGKLGFLWARQPLEALVHLGDGHPECRYKFSPDEHRSIPGIGIFSDNLVHNPEAGGDNSRYFPSWNASGTRRPLRHGGNDPRTF